MVGIPQDVIDHLKKEGKRKRSEWGIADLRKKASPEAHDKWPLFGIKHANKIEDFAKQLETAAKGFTSPSDEPGYYVLEWRLKPITRLTRAQMDYVGKGTKQSDGKIDKADRKKRLKDCGIDIDANGCGCGCGCGE